MLATGSGVYKISVKWRRRGALDADGVMCIERGWAPPQKKNHFVPKMISLGVLRRGF